MARKDNKGRNLHTGEQQRKEDGIYLFRYTDMCGKRKTVYAGDLPELRQKEKQIQRDLDDNIVTDTIAKKITLNEMFERYLETLILADNTRVNYKKMWNNRVRNEIGNIKVVQLKSSNIKGFYTKLSKAGYSHSTIKLLHNMIYPALEMAVDDDIIRKNPAKKALSMDYGTEEKEKDALTLDQQDKLLKFIEESNVYNAYVPMITILLETALRCGELIGLTWEDVSIPEKMISVNHQLIYKDFGDGYKFHISSPKTSAGVRKIPLTEKAKKAFLEQKRINFMLERHCAEEVDGYKDFIFITKTNRVLMPSAVNNILYNIINAYNKKELSTAQNELRPPELIPKFSVHTLRHTACTNKARQNMNIKVLQAIMGHSNSNITLDVYNHLNNDIDIINEVKKCENGEKYSVPKAQKKVQ